MKRFTRLAVAAALAGGVVVGAGGVASASDSVDIRPCPNGYGVQVWTPGPDPYVCYEP